MLLLLIKKKIITLIVLLIFDIILNQEGKTPLDENHGKFWIEPNMFQKEWLDLQNR